MTADEKIEFARLYFGSERLHDDFEILETAHGIVRAIPDTIEEDLVYRMVRALLERRGVFSNLRHVKYRFFPQIKRAFAALFPQALVTYHASHRSASLDRSFEEAFLECADSLGYSIPEGSHTVMVNLFDYAVLFKALAPGDEKRIEETAENSATFAAFTPALNFLLYEKKFVSVRNFNLLKIHTFVTHTQILDAAKKWIRFVTGKMSPAAEKPFIYCLALLLLEGSEDSALTVSESLSAVGGTNDTIQSGLQSLALLVSRAGVDTPAASKFHTILTNNIGE